MKRPLIVLLVLGGAAAALTTWYFAASVWMSGPIEARVVDANTGLPVSGAIVLANWELKGMEGWVVDRAAFFEAVTDERGVFRIPAWGPLIVTRGRIRGESPWVSIYDRRYRPALLMNSAPRPWEETYLWSHFRKPSLNGRTVRLDPFHGTPQEYVEPLFPFQQSVAFLYVGGHCEWQRAPRMMDALQQLRNELGDAAVASGLLSLDDIPGAASCAGAVARD